MQHADHFTRILNEKESIKREKFSEIKSENINSSSDEILETSEDSSKITQIENQKEESEVKKVAKTQAEIN